jgi:hypothetical protein
MAQTEEDALTLLAETLLPERGLTQEEAREIQIKLWRLLALQTEHYTMGDHSSIPVEKAEELLKSIVFAINVYLKKTEESPSSLLKDADLLALLKKGWFEIAKQVKRGKALLEAVKASSPGADNISYRDTIAGIEVFFKRYDPRFFAHEIPGNIDYQLCHPVSDTLLGIEYINEYLRRLLAENEFCGRFPLPNRLRLLCASYLDYKGLLVNLYEPVAANALALALTEGVVFSLDVSEKERDVLLRLFEGRSRAGIGSEMARAAGTLCGTLEIKEPFLRDYLFRTADGLCPRVLAAVPAANLSGVFPSLGE